MNSDELRKILDEHKVWVKSLGEDGSKADLCRANLREADLYGAKLREADLRGADLRGANLFEANLYGANLPEFTFMIIGETYPITITNGEYLRAGCQHHSVEKWRQFTKEEISGMDGRKALEFYPRLLDILDFY
ncbi:MAG: pentapeptide repeat-containing protein, partial [Arsenophonus sp.]